MKNDGKGPLRYGAQSAPYKHHRSRGVPFSRLGGVRWEKGQG
jgi:hypothetical protein